MAEDCPNCEWPTEDDMTTTIHGTGATPDYVRVNGTQIKRCPDCFETLETTENTTPGI
jgi:Zn-finger protein